MAETVDNLVTHRLGSIRADIGVVKDRSGDVEAKIDGLSGAGLATGRYLHDIDGRIETLEAEIGG